MDAAELMEWVAHTNLQDEKYCNKLENKIACEKSEDEKNKAVRRLLMGI